MASFKNKIDLKKTKRFLSPFLSSIRRPLSPFSVAKTSSPFFGKEEKFDNRIDSTLFFDYVAREKMVRETFYQIWRNHSNIYLKSKKSPLFSQNEIRTSKQISLSSKEDNPLLRISGCDEHMPRSFFAYSASLNTEEENLERRSFFIRKENTHLSPSVSPFSSSVPHLRRNTEEEKDAKRDQIEERDLFCRAKPIDRCNDAERYLQIFFHCNVERIQELDKSTSIQKKDPNMINAYLRKKYKPFRFKSLTQRGQSVHNIGAITRSSSLSSLSQKISQIFYRRQRLLMRLSFLRSFSPPFCGCSTKNYAFHLFHSLQQKQSNELRFLFEKARGCVFSTKKDNTRLTSPLNTEEEKGESTTPNLCQFCGTKSDTEDIAAMRKSVSTAKKGNHFVIVLKKKSFWLLEKLVKDKHISILGGIYGKTPISKNSIFSLAKQIEEDTLYYRSISLLQEKPSLFLKTLNNVYSRLLLTLYLSKDHKHHS